MAANPKQELHNVVDQLSDTAAADTLAYARSLLHRAPSAARQPQESMPEREYALPTLHRAPAIGTIDELRAPLFAPEDSADAFDAAIRRWREAPEDV